MILMFAVAYSLLLAVTVMFLDRALQPEPRMLLPLLPLALVGAAWALRGRAGFVVAALICLSFVARDVSIVEARRAGFAYMSIQWRESATLAAALELKDGPVYTNNPQPLILYGRTQPRTLPVAVEADESAASLADVVRLANDRAVDVVNLKVAKIGGVRATLAAIEICEANAISCRFGASFGPSILQAFTAHLAAIPVRLEHACELAEHLHLLDDPFSPLPVVNGQLAVPDGIGSGVDSAS